MGNGSTVSSHSPSTAVDTNGSPIFYDDFDMRDDVACGVDTNAGVCCVGSDAFGLLGGTGNTRQYPTWNNCLGLRAQEVSLASDHACAIVADGTVACWGDNSFGQLGQGNTGAPSMTALTVPGLSDVVQLSSGRGFTCAVQADGGVFCWGDNSKGVVGGQAPVSATTPALVISGANRISAGNNHVCAELSDLTIKCWGDNTFNQIHSDSFGIEWQPVDLERF